MKLLILLFFILFGSKGNCYAQANMTVEEENSIVFTKVETEASFPGGTSSWMEFLQKNLRGDIPVKKKAPVGTYPVVVRFIVGKDGKLEEISPETDFGYGMEKEVIRVIKSGPKWLPAMQNNRVVRAWRRQPVTFVVSAE